MHRHNDAHCEPGYGDEWHGTPTHFVHLADELSHLIGRAQSFADGAQSEKTDLPRPSQSNYHLRTYELKHASLLKTLSNFLTCKLCTHRGHPANALQIDAEDLTAPSINELYPPALWGLWDYASSAFAVHTALSYYIQRRRIGYDPADLHHRLK